MRVLIMMSVVTYLALIAGSTYYRIRWALHIKSYGLSVCFALPALISLPSLFGGFEGMGLLACLLIPTLIPLFQPGNPLMNGDVAASAGNPAAVKLAVTLSDIAAAVMLLLVVVLRILMDSPPE